MLANLPPILPAETSITITNSQPTPAIPELGSVKSKAQPKLAITNQTTPASAIELSPNNPCPFLRMLVTQGYLPNHQATRQQITDAIQRMAKAGDTPQQHLPSFAIKSIASIANGLKPTQIAHNIREGVEMDNLRYHILDKNGSGTRILDKNAQFVPTEMARLASFGSPKTDKNGTTELGLNEKEIQIMLDANFARVKGHRRLIDRQVMNGELPILLKVMGKQTLEVNGHSERYLAVSDIERLFKDKALPQRMLERLS